ncbi:hypothetical protein C8R45DRAFT_837110 [Mycena sanguinolenta]|nr:hypothetical protein C8R45DRAFT_837110 [Mycena sanguinolenta]
MLSEASAPAREEEVRGCLHGTRRDILSEIDEWLETENPSENIFWLYGYPGSGKSSVASTLAERPNLTAASSLFFRRKEIPNASPSAFDLWITLAADLCRLGTVFGKQLVESLENDPKPINQQTDSVHTVFKRLIYNPILRCTSALRTHQVFVVVDALDECRGMELNAHSAARRKEILACLKQWAELPGNFKLLVTSREHPDIEEALKDISRSRELSLTTAATKADIRQFVEKRCGEIAAEIGSSETIWHDETTFEKLAARAGGLFIYAVTLMDFVCYDTESIVGPMEDDGILVKAGDIGALYEGILNISFPEGRFPDTFPVTFQAVAGAIAFTKTGADTKNVILDILKVKPDILGLICTRLQPVLDRTKPNILRFRHRSFVDYLTSDFCRSTLRVPRERELRRLVLGCLLALNPASQRRNEPSTSLIHAALFWGHYVATMLKKPQSEIVTAATLFLHHNFLSWLEVLSLIGRMDVAIESLISLKHYLEPTHCGLSNFIGDAIDFVTDFYEPISTSAPHIYISALTFTAKHSSIFLTYGDSFPKRISLSSHNARTDLYRGEIGEINSLSAAGTGRIAVAHLKRIQRWDYTTGFPISIPLQHIAAVTCMSFSPDRKTLVTGSEDARVRIWNLESPREPIREMAGHTAAVTCVAFLAATVVSGSKDGTIRIRDPHTGDELAKYTPHPGGSVASIAVLSDSHVVSISSVGNSFQVFKFAHGSITPDDENIFQAADILTCITRSHTARWIVAGSKDHTVRIWSRETGQEAGISPLSGHSGPVTCIAVHGNYIASGSEDRTIKLWNLKTGKPVLGRLHGHSDTITALTFSNDGSQLFSGSADHIVRMWDISEAGNPNQLDLIDTGRNWLMDSKGWIRGGHGERLVWLPEKERERICWGRCKAIMDRRAWKRLDFLATPQVTKPKTGANPRIAVASRKDETHEKNRRLRRAGVRIGRLTSAVNALGPNFGAGSVALGRGCSVEDGGGCCA